MSIILPSFAGIVGPVSSGGGGALSNTYSLEYDGTDDYAEVTGLGLSGATSFSIWFNPQATSNFYPLFHADPSGVYIDVAIGSFRAYIYDNTNGGYLLRSYSLNPVLNTWYHLVVTVDAGNTTGTGASASLKLYVNGAEVYTTGVGKSGGFQTFNYPSSLPLDLGARTHNSTYANQLIDEVAIFGSELSASDITAIYNQGVPADLASYSPVGWWRMGDNDSGTGTTITDQGSGGNDATLTNGPTFSTDVPIFNKFSLDFDGTNDYIDCGGSSDFSFTDGSGNDSAFSISAWVKFDNIYTSRLVSKDTSTSSREYLFGTNGNNKVNMLLGNASVNLDIQNNTTLNTTDWFHVVATYDGSKTASGLKVYVNADASSLTNNSLGSYSGMPSTSGSLEIGRFANGHSFLNGLVDEIAVFNTELSSAQVTSIYNSGVPNNIASLSPLGWWRMGDNDGGTGTTITDQGSGGNDGTLNNGPTFSTDVPT